jgi:hypothetical protein
METRRKRAVGWRLPPNHYRITRATLCLMRFEPDLEAFLRDMDLDEDEEEP